MKEVPKEAFEEVTKENIEKLHQRYNEINRWVLADIPERSAYRYPDKEAVIFEDNTYTYQEFEEVTNRFANFLLDLGLEKFDRVGVFLGNTHHHAIEWYGCLKAGVIEVPINTMLRGEDISSQVQRVGPKGFIVEDRLLGSIETVMDDMKSVDEWVWSEISGDVEKPERFEHDFDQVLEEYPADKPEVDLDIHDVVQFLFTSGTTAKPKCVMLTNQNILSQCYHVIIDGFCKYSDGIQLHTLPFYHCAQKHTCFDPGIMLGQKNIIAPGTDPETILSLIEKYKVTTAFFAPALWRAIVQYPDFDKYDTSSFKRSLTGSAPTSKSMIRKIQEKFEGLEFWNGYGQTETVPFHTVLKPDKALEKAGSVGKGMLNAKTLIVDEEDNVLNEPGDQGEIACKSPIVMLGYYGQPEKTEEVNRNDRFHTEDIGRLDEDGYITIVDRKKDIIITGGENVSSIEVQNAIMENEKVSEAAVVGLPHERWGEGVTAVVTPVEGKELTKEEVLKTVEENIPSKFKRPQDVIIVGSIPKTPTKKYDKVKIREMYEDHYK